MKNQAKAGAVARPKGVRIRQVGRLDVARLAALVVATFLVAGTADAKAACVNQAIRQQQASTFLPDCRAYELVTPRDKIGGGIKFDASEVLGGTAFSPDGTTAVYPSYFAFAGAEGVVTNSYRAERDGPWRSFTLTPTPTPTDTVFTGSTNVTDASADLETAIFETIGTYSPLDTNLTNDVYIRTGTGPIELASVGNEEDISLTGARYAGRSSNGRHVLFEAEPGLVPVAAGSPQAAGSTLYDRSDGATSIVGLNPDGSLVSACGATLADTAGSSYEAISGNGSRVVFRTPDPAGFGDPSCEDPVRLWLRDGGSTVEVSASEIGGDPSLTHPSFAGMSRDGSTIYFNSQEKLTADALTQAGLYKFDVASGDLSYVAGEGTVLTVSTDGQVVYYQALDLSLHVIDHATQRAVVTAPVPDLALNLRGWSAAPDGSSFVFASAADITGYDSVGHFEIYRVEASGESSLLCISCPSGGRKPTGDAKLAGAGQAASLSPELRPRSALANGFAYFETPDRLVPEDSNTSLDVYEFAGRTLHLISPGLGPDPSYFAGASASGKSVFFATTAGLVGSDGDNANDLYDAIVDGGTLEPDPVQPCAGESCQGTPVSSPIASAPGSVTVQGTGNPRHPRHKAYSRCVRRKSAAHRSKRRCEGKKAHKRSRRNHRAGNHRGGSR